MHRAAFVTDESDEAYMAGVARRTRMMDGSEVRHDTEEHFLRDLDAMGQVKREVTD